MQQAHGQSRRARILGIEDEDLQLLVEEEEEACRESGDKGDELHVVFEHVRRLPEDVRLKPRLRRAAIVGVSLDEALQDHAEAEEAREEDGEIGVETDARVLVRRLDGEEGDGGRRHRADEQHGGAARRKRHEGEDDAWKRRVPDGIADEALPLVDAQRADGRRDGREKRRAEGDDLEGVVRHNVHRLTPSAGKQARAPLPCPGPSGSRSP